MQAPVKIVAITEMERAVQLDGIAIRSDRRDAPPGPHLLGDADKADCRCGGIRLQRAGDDKVVGLDRLRGYSVCAEEPEGRKLIDASDVCAAIGDGRRRKGYR